jgi:hypothetical protein
MPGAQWFGTVPALSNKVNTCKDNELHAWCGMPQGPAGAGGGGGAGGEGPQAPASAATAAAAAAAAMAASQKWKSIDSGVRQQVYQYFKERLAVS